MGLEIRVAVVVVLARSLIKGFNYYDKNDNSLSNLLVFMSRSFAPPSQRLNLIKSKIILGLEMKQILSHVGIDIIIYRDLYQIYARIFSNFPLAKIDDIF